MDGASSSRPGRSHDPSKRRSTGSVASAVAESTISFNTLATGLSAFTGEGLRLSQFPPPPETLPGTPLTAGFGGTPSPVASSSSFYVAIGHGGGPQGPSSLRDARSVPPSPNSAQQDHPLRSPPTAFHASSSRRFPVSAVSSPSSQGRQLPQVYDSQIAPTDWHDGSSSIDVQPFEAKMLSTSLITELLSSADSAISSGSDIPPSGSARQSQLKPGRYGSVSQFSEMTYPPSLPRHPPHQLDQLDQIHKVLARSDDPYDPASPDMRTDNDTIASFDGDAQVVRYAGASRMVSVVGMAPARVQQYTPEAAPSLGQPSPRNSMTTFNSQHPLQRQLSIPATAEELEASPIVSGLRGPPPSALRPPRTRRSSTHSNKSVKSQVSSFISNAGESAARLARSTVEWFRVKPLPPVPTLRNMTLAQEQQYKAQDYAQPLPALALRAERLDSLLAQGRLPANSMYSGEMLGGEGYEKLSYHEPGARASALQYQTGGRKRMSVGGAAAFATQGVDLGTIGEGTENLPGSPSKTHRPPLKWPTTRKGKIRLALIVGLAAVIVLVAIIVGVVVSQKHGTHCSGNMTGDACTLDATCVCTESTGQSQCTPVAASLINMVPTVNTALNANFTSSDVAASVLAAFGRVHDCSAQARVIDVATALDAAVVPNRTAWAQSTLMWSFVLSESPSNVAKLQTFVRSADWASVQNVDGPIPSASSRFSTTMMGFTFDFASQTITEPSVSFATDGQASSAQLSRLTENATAALDRVYTAASAMSTLQSSAISTYWTLTLNQSEEDYATFISLLMASPVLLPFNAANSSVAALLTSSTSLPFPPPASCYPGLSSAALSQLSSVETQVFGLPAPAQQASFQTACYADRPIYGTLDYLRLRLPHRDSDKNLSAQAAVLSLDVRPRIVVSNGRQFSALPGGPAPASVQTDVRQYGTMTHLNHVIRDFFASISDVSVATAVVQYVLSQSAVPPPSSSTLVQNIDSLPILEVAVFGSVLPADVDAVLSSFSTPSGNLFFGTDGSFATRTWALNATGSYVAWAEAATASQVVHDGSFSDANFNAVWDPAFQFFHSSTNAVVGISNITNAFSNEGKFSSS
ncbi:hypothetical protein K488DRAFT_67456 [Vararia minispora EC-137]|uniref:Uncharacterized protein n=1 Tax=Vararia minispora EC-137 TaxID=1314806 RepID=A0ACB8QXR0_9AGAM|nr:hypothetical protein K488DRAFT_67456 [Vararia minispora EC-137]